MDDELRKRIMWGLKLKAFYDNSESFPDHVKADTLKDMLGLNEKNWQRLKNWIKIEHPVVEQIEKDEAKRKNSKGFITPKAFDEKYFPDKFREYITQRSVDNFENRFYQPKTVAHALTGIEGSLDTLVNEGKILGMNIEELKPYELNTADKRGEFYLKDEITELKGKLQKGISLKKLKIALGISAKIDEARDERATDYEILENAAKKLGIEVEELGIYIKKDGPLTVGNIGIVNILTNLINKSYSTNFNETDIVDFCKNDERYPGIRRTTGILNLDGFIENTFTIDEARQEVSGEGWLAKKIFEYCLNEIKPHYLKINKKRKIHESYVEKIKRYQTTQMPLDAVRREIALKLRVNRVGNRYPQLNMLTRDTNKDHLAEITVNVDKFIDECYDKAKIESVVDAGFLDNNSLQKIMAIVSIGSMAFLGNNYHTSDVNKLKKAVDNSRAKISVTNQRLVELAERGYINLCESGLSDVEATRLSNNSYSLGTISEISKKLSESPEIKQLSFSYNEEKFCPIGDIRKYIMQNPTKDITKEGIVMLISDEKWKDYVAQESNGNNNASQEDINHSIGTKIVDYLINDLNITPTNRNYTGEDIAMLNSFIELLQDNNIHRIASFRSIDEGTKYTVDPDESYYTRTEILKMMDANGRELGVICDENNIECISLDRPIGDRDHNDIELYKLRDTAEILKYKGDERLRLLNDPLEVVIMYNVLKACETLDIEADMDNFLNKVGHDNFSKLSYRLKIGANPNNIIDSACYQRMDSAFRTINKVQEEMFI